MLHPMYCIAASESMLARAQAGIVPEGKAKVDATRDADGVHCQLNQVRDQAHACCILVLENLDDLGYFH